MVSQHAIQGSDGQLVRNYQQRKNTGVVSVLYRRYFQKVFVYCLRIIGNREDARDVASEVFVKLIENLDRLHDIDHFQQWLFRIARNEAFDLCLQRQKKRTFPLEDFYHLADPGPRPWETKEKEENFAKMKAAFQALPRESRDLLKAKYYDGESIETLMERYRSTGSALKMRLARARKKANKNFSIS